MALYHYTVQSHLPTIVATGQIALATIGLPQGERPVVWLTASPRWEETANKSMGSPDGKIRHLNRMQTMEAFGLARISVAEACGTHDFEGWRNASGVAPKMAEVLLALARQKASPVKLWRVSFTPIPRAQWISVEVYDTGGKEWLAEQMPDGGR